MPDFGDQIGGLKDKLGDMVDNSPLVYPARKLGQLGGQVQDAWNTTMQNIMTYYKQHMASKQPTDIPLPPKSNARSKRQTPRS